MDDKNYIESGILELYVAGALNEAEQKEVELMAAQNTEISDELKAIQLAFENYALAHAIAPPKHVLDSILSVVKEKGTSQTTAKTIQMKPAQGTASNMMRYLAYAASILLFISLIANVYYYNKFVGVQSDLAAMSNEKLELANQFDVVHAGYQQLQSDLSIIKNPNIIAVTMKGQAASPNSTSLVYWDKSTGNVYISANNLPIPPAGKQYQLWALKDNKPIDAGMFDMNGELQSMKNIFAADAFAVTLEPIGGSISPTMEQLYVVGAV